MTLLITTLEASSLEMFPFILICIQLSTPTKLNPLFSMLFESRPQSEHWIMRFLQFSSNFFIMQPGFACSGTFQHKSYLSWDWYQYHTKLSNLWSMPNSLIFWYCLGNRFIRMILTIPCNRNESFKVVFPLLLLWLVLVYLNQPLKGNLTWNVLGVSLKSSA